MGGGGPLEDAKDAVEIGRGTSLAVFLRLVIDAWGPGAGGVGTARPGSAGMAGAAPKGGLGADGTLGADGDDSVSDIYDAVWFARSNVSLLFLPRDLMGATNLPPVSTPPPRFLSFGIPPANKPDNCGAGSVGALLFP